MNKILTITIIFIYCSISNAQNLTYNRVLNWGTNSSQQTWTPSGALTNSFKYDTTNPAAIDVSMSFITNGLSLLTALISNTPVVTNLDTGGLTNNNFGLHVAFNAPNNNTNTTFTTAQMFFHYTNNLFIPGVSNLSFQIFDIDVGGGSSPPYTSFQDRIFNVRGTNSAGQLVYANLTTTNTTPSFSITGTGSANNVVLGTNSAPNSGAGAEAGTLQIDFGTNNMTYVTFDYSPGPNGPSDPNGQRISISHIYYYIIPIPEPSTFAMIGIGVIFGLMGIGRHYGKRKQP